MMSTNELATRHLPYTPEEFTWARWRPKAHRTPTPAMGDRVLYRHDAWVTPVDATVLDVIYHDEGPGQPDLLHCFRVRTHPNTATPVYDQRGQMVLDPHPDTWPTLLLQVDGQASHVQTREARLRGSAGWLPLDWHTRERPLPGREGPR